jgi:hypothetical protein
VGWLPGGPVGWLPGGSAGWQPSYSVCWRSGGLVGWRPSRLASIDQVGLHGSGLVGLQDRGPVDHQEVAAWGWPPAFSVYCVMEKPSIGWGQGAKVSVLPCALPQPSVSPAYQQGP